MITFSQELEGAAKIKSDQFSEFGSRTNNVLYSLHFRFRNKHSTLHALISLAESIKKTIDDGMYGCSVLTDLQKAFDTVNHSILLKVPMKRNFLFFLTKEH